MTAERPDPRAPRELLIEAINEAARRRSHLIGPAPFGHSRTIPEAVDEYLATPAGARLLALAETGVAVGSLPEYGQVIRLDGRWQVRDMSTWGGNRAYRSPDLSVAITAMLEGRAAALEARDG